MEELENNLAKKGRSVFTNAEGEKVYEDASPSDRPGLNLWLQNQRDGLIAKALNKKDASELWRIEKMTDEELIQELGISYFPETKIKEDQKRSLE